MTSELRHVMARLVEGWDSLATKTKEEVGSMLVGAVIEGLNTQAQEYAVESKARREQDAIVEQGDSLRRLERAIDLLTARLTPSAPPDGIFHEGFQDPPRDSFTSRPGSIP